MTDRCSVQALNIGRSDYLLPFSSSEINLARHRSDPNGSRAAPARDPVKQPVCGSASASNRCFPFTLANMPVCISRRSAVVALVAACTASAALAEEPRGTFGFAAKVDAEGVFSPTLKSVFVHSVQPGMPAAIAGMVAGDSIVEVEGAKVAGSKASAMADRMKKRPGEALVLKLLRASGDSYVVTLTAVASTGMAPANAAAR